jgi:acetyl-CoA carboxylase biotin carboxyl carrier protein
VLDLLPQNCFKLKRLSLNQEQTLDAKDIKEIKAIIDLMKKHDLSPAAKPIESLPLKEIVSPMVGTFYRAASPDAPAFVEVGKPVTEDTVVCIIEAMKVMNEIKAETSGVIAEVLAENGKPVQFGQALFRVR